MDGQQYNSAYAAETFFFIALKRNTILRKGAYLICQSKEGQ